MLANTLPLLGNVPTRVVKEGVHWAIVRSRTTAWFFTTHQDVSNHQALTMEAIPMNHFRLFAHGEAFDPDAYLATTALTFDGVWHKGESGHDHPKSSGVFKVLGDGPTVPLFKQEQVAIDYLTANREALSALAREPGVTTFILGLHYQIRLEEGTVGFTVGPSAPLMRLALEIGIAPTYYVTIERSEEWKDELDV